MRNTKLNFDTNKTGFNPEAIEDVVNALYLLYSLCNAGQPPGNDDLDIAFLALKKAITKEVGQYETINPS